jgi:hypothetical protein
MLVMRRKIMMKALEVYINVLMEEGSVMNYLQETINAKRI